MFNDLSPVIQEKLIKKNKLIRMNVKGKQLDSVYREDDGPSIRLLGPIPLPILIHAKTYQAQWYCATRSTESEQAEALRHALLTMDPVGPASISASISASIPASSVVVNSLVVMGDPATWQNPLVRIHSNCFTGDVLGSQRCECGPQLESALEKISQSPDGGMLIYMAGHEGRGIGLWAKAATYLLQDEGEDTYQANESLGLPADSRDFTDAGALVWRFIGNRPFRLLSNNPQKVACLAQCGLTQIVMEKHVVGVTETNKDYLRAKKCRGHQFMALDL